MINPVKAGLDISIQHPLIALGAEMMNLSDCVLGSPPRPEPVGDRLEVGLEDRFQHQLQRRLDDPVRDHGNPESPNLSRPARLGNQSLPHRQRSEQAGLQIGP
jgi:hypothetical protein